MSVAEYDRNDGFSPGSTLILHVPELANSVAFERTAPVGLADISQSFAPAQPVVVIDEATSERQPIWSELDPSASTEATRNLLIHPAAALADGHTYVVALRNLRNSSGRAIRPPRWFALLRSGGPLPARERSQRGRYANIFAALERAGIKRGSLYEAWDFTVGSAQSLTSRLLAIRDDAFAQLGDYDLDGVLSQGRAPTYTVTASEALTPQLRRVQGSFEVPCYLLTCGATATTGFHYSSSNPNAVPSQIPGNVATVPFECIVPSAASGDRRARLVLYGHGFLSSSAEVEAENLQRLALRYDIALCATDWWGLAKADTPFLRRALANVNELPAVVDRVQQGVLNALYLGRLMRDPQGFASSPAFQANGQSLLDTSGLYYYGDSDGGILGGVLTALAPEFRRAVLGVAGSDFFNLMVPRGDAFSYFGSFVLHNYPDASLHPVVLDLLQQLWDRADPDGYSAQETTNPLPATPPHTVLMQVAYGDFEVSMYAAAYEARSIGASAYEPALDLETNRAQDRNLLFGVPPISAYPFSGSAIVLWDSGPGRTAPPPLAALPPSASATNVDPHEDPRYTPRAQEQISDFLRPGGAVDDVCAGEPCAPPWYAP